MKVSKSPNLVNLDRDLRSCRLCLESGFEITPGAIFSHPLRSDVMLIGQAPGITEVEAQRPFNAGSGTRLFQWLAEADWPEAEFRANNVMTAVTKCYPGKGKNGKGDRVPSKTEQEFCRSYLEREIAYYHPKLLILVGGLAIKLVYPAQKKLKEVIGTAGFVAVEDYANLLDGAYDEMEIIDSDAAIRKQDGCWIVPLPHPSGASLWPNKEENRVLITQAVTIIGRLRELYNL